MENMEDRIKDPLGLVVGLILGALVIFGTLWEIYNKLIVPTVISGLGVPILTAPVLLVLIGAILAVFNRPVKGARRRWDRVFYVSLVATLIVMGIISVIVEPPLVRMLYPGPQPSWLWWEVDVVIMILVLILPFFLFWDDVKEALEEAKDGFEERTEHIRLTKEEEQPVTQLDRGQVTQQPVGEAVHKSWISKIFGKGGEGSLLEKFLPIEIAGEFLSNLLFRLIKFAE